MQEFAELKVLHDEKSQTNKSDIDRGIFIF